MSSGQDLISPTQTGLEENTLSFLLVSHFADALIQRDLQEQLGLSAFLKATSTDFSPSQLGDSNQRPFGNWPKALQPRGYPATVEVKWSTHSQMHGRTHTNTSVSFLLSLCKSIDLALLITLFLLPLCHLYLSVDTTASVVPLSLGTNTR